MNKSIKIFVIIIISIIIILGMIVYSFSETNVEVNDTTFDTNIIQAGLNLNPIYDGFILIVTEITVFNSGMLDIRNLKVNILAEFTPTLSQNNLFTIGRGENKLGTIPADSTVDLTIEVNATENIPLLAVSDGVIFLTIDISINLQYLPFETDIQKNTQENWQSPFI